MRTAETIAEHLGKPIAEIRRTIEIAKRATVPVRETIVVSDNGRQEYLEVTRNGVGLLKTKYGKFYQFDFEVNDKWAKYSVIYSGKIGPDFRPIFPELTRRIKMRIDSGCETGQVFGDFTCDCRPQLEEALSRIAGREAGLVINIPSQDGRGFGLSFKLATLTLQDELKVSTTEAGDLLIPDGSKDIRTYAGVVAILKFLGVEPGWTIVSMSNNDKKHTVLAENGYLVEQEEIVIEATEHTRIHFRAKQEDLGHKGLVRGDDLAPKDNEPQETIEGAPQDDDETPE